MANTNQMYDDMKRATIRRPEYEETRKISLVEEGNHSKAHKTDNPTDDRAGFFGNPGAVGINSNCVIYPKFSFGGKKAFGPLYGICEVWHGICALQSTGPH